MVLLAPTALALGLLILQGTLLSSLQLDLLAPVVVYVALEADPLLATLFALLMGFLADTLTGSFIGLGMALNLGVLLLARLLRRHLMLQSLTVRVAACALCLSARHLLLAALGVVVLDWPPEAASFWLGAAAQVAVLSALSLPFFALLDRAQEMLAFRQQPL